MEDLNERLRSSTAAFTGDLRLDDPSSAMPTSSASSSSTFEAVVVPLSTRSSGTGGRLRRWSSLAAVSAGIAAAAVAFVVLGGMPRSDRVVPAIDESASSTSALIDLDPAQRLRAAVAATRASQSFRASSDVESVDGAPVGVGNGGGFVTYQSPGLASVTVQKRDGTWITNEYYDLVERRRYWLHDEGRWKSAAMLDSDSGPVELSVERLLGERGSCVLEVDELRILVVQRPVDSCPAVAPPESDWPALGTSKQLVTLRPDGRLAELRTPTDEMPFPLPGVGPIEMVTWFTDYDSAPPVVPPDASSVTEVSLPAVGGGWSASTITGYVEELDLCEGPGAAPECPTE